mgnify:CR=1 FL=1
MKFDYDDIALVPAETSKIKSRYTSIELKTKEPYNRLMTAPMDTVCNSGKSVERFKNRHIRVVLPRYSMFKKSLRHFYYVTYSITLQSLKERINFGKITPKNYYQIIDKICLDMANGHLEHAIPLIKKFKLTFPDKKLIVGNIGNPQTYRILAKTGVDAIRVGIGAGSGCLTSEQTSIYYPMASLVKECYDVKKELDHAPKIIADGGIRKYADIIKALNLGADYVMIGGLFNKMVESSPRSYLFRWIPISEGLSKKIYKTFPVYKKFRGMSTKEVQLQHGKQNIRTSEGIRKYNRVRYDLDSWLDNFNHYLRSAMSYSDSKDLEDFIGKQNYIRISNKAYKRFSK